MMIKLVCTALRGVNQITLGEGISYNIRPLTILKVQETVNYKTLQASFIKYAQVYDENGRNNINAQQSLGAIALSMTPNTNGHYIFMSLNTVKMISRKQFTLLPITEEVKQRVE